jgi:hypothetical protein
MRVSFYFRGADDAVVGQQHFFVTDQSPGWTGDLATSPFEKRVEQVNVPADAVSILLTLTSGGPLQVTGTFIIDDLSIRPPSAAGFEIASLSKVANGWQLSWNSETGKTYSVESASTLAPNSFQPVPELQSISASDGATTTAIDDRSSLGPTQFYRVMEAP